MSLELREVRVPTPIVRAERILATLESQGLISEYVAAGPMSPNVGTALLRTKIAGQAMTLPNAAIIGETIHIKLIQLKTPGNDTVVVTPVSLTGGTTITFSVKDHHVVLIWGGSAWGIRGGNTAVIS